MTAILEAEASRLEEQIKLDRLKTARQRNRWGQFATPPDLSLDIARYAWNKLRRRKGGFRFLDPAIGTGSFFGALIQTFVGDRILAATGIELDKSFAEAAKTIWQRQGLQVIQGDFTKQKPESVYDVILTNPPYVRHHHLAAEEKVRLRELAQRATGLRLSGLSGLYCYFLLIAHDWLAKDGLAAWLIPSEFMDVNYGEEIKRYLTERVSLLQIHRFCPSDVQFDDALVSSAIVLFENRKPKADHAAVFSFGGTLAQPAKTDVVPLDELRTTKKWTSLPRRSNGRPKTGTASATLGDFFTVKRGLATGSNDFFILPREQLSILGIPDVCVRPILPSPRYLKQEIVEADADGWPALDRQLALIACEFKEEEIRAKWPGFAAYLEDGRRRGIHEGYITSRRCPWYSQEKREPATFLCTYMGRSLEKPFRFIWNRSEATAANVYLALYPKTYVAATITKKTAKVFGALQAILPEHFLSEGRVYGGGLYKMEPAELMRLPTEGLAELLEVAVEQQRSLF